jgi:hypothetical protein
MDEIGTARSASQSKHCHKRDKARSATYEKRRCITSPHKPAANRSAHFQFVTRNHLIVQESGDLTAGQSLDGELDVVGAVRSGGN